MAEPVRVSFVAPHEPAADFIRGKPIVSREAFDRLLDELRCRAFTVTGVERINLLRKIRDRIADVAGAATTWDEARADIAQWIEADLGEQAERRAELLLRTHAFQAFQAAHWQAGQLDDTVTHYEYLTMEDDRVRPSHAALDGVVLPKDDPFWLTHTPPWDWGCRCRIRPLHPYLVRELEQREAGLPPEQRHVLTSELAEQLRAGTRIDPRSGQRVDVTPPSWRPGAQHAWQWSPQLLRLSWAQLERAYADDPESWNAFVQWAERTKVDDGRTVREWLDGFGTLDRADQWLAERYAQEWLRATPEEKNAAQQYAARGAEWNAQLAAGRLAPEHQEHHGILLQAVGRWRTPAATIWRGLRGIERQQLERLEVGDIWVRPCWGSFTAAWSVAPAFARERTLLELTVPAGMPMVPMVRVTPMREAELLLPPGLRVQITDIAEEGGYRIVRGVAIYE